MAHLRFTRPFQRFLSLVLADRPEPQQMEDLLRGTVALGDYSDVAPPHQNPNFGFRVSTTAGAGLAAGVTIAAISRAIRIRQIFISAGTTVRAQVFAEADDPMSVVTAAVAATSMGPVDDVPTSRVREGTAAAPPLAASFAAEQVQWNVRPSFLIAPGHLIAFFDGALAGTLTMAAILEEIPRFGEVANAGYPGPND